MPDTLKVITRNSALASRQVTRVLDRIPALKYSLISLRSVGYNQAENFLPGYASTEICQRGPDQAILQGEADLVIQSAEDLPYPLHAGLEVIALLETFDRTDPTKSLRNIETYQERHDSMPYAVSPARGQKLLVIVALANRPELKVLFAINDIRNQFGKITLVGFGPGNPDLLTLGGDKALSQSDIIFHDDLLDRDYLKKYTAEKVYVGKRKGSHCVEQNEINRMILGAAKAGKQVVRLKGGDPMIFAHGGEEIEYLERNFVKVEVIPGVSAGIAVASLLKVPLTHRGIASSVAFISGHSENVHLPDADTLIIYMGGSNIRAIARKAIEQGRNAEIQVMMVYNLSLPGQQEFFFTLRELALTEQKFPTPIIIIIGEVVSFRNKPVAELSTSNTPVSGTDTLHFYDLGEKQEKLRSFEWLIFTNSQMVSLFFDAMQKLGRDSRFMAGLKIAAVGKNTAGKLKEHGILADLIPGTESPEGFHSRIKELGIAPSKALIPLFIPGLSTLQQSLKELGWEVNQLVLSRNVFRKNFSPLASHPLTNPDYHQHRGYPTIYDIKKII